MKVVVEFEFDVPDDFEPYHLRRLMDELTINGVLESAVNSALENDDRLEDVELVAMEVV